MTNYNNNISSWPETATATATTISADRQMAIEKLLQGARFATQLQTLMINQPQLIENESYHVDVEDLVSKISDSFSDTISILNLFDQTDEVSLDPAKSSLVGDGRKSEDSGGDSSGSRSSTVKDRRGCYKRRKSANSWTTMTQTLTDDGHAWRKYGQKKILDAKQPRNYYRCTHKHDQGCQAKKQVQKTEDIEKPMFRITYNGQHTCRTLLQTPQIIFDPTINDLSSPNSFYLNFGSHNSAKDGNVSSYMHSSLTSIKKENKDNQVPIDVVQKPEYQLSPDMRTFEASGGHVSLTSSAFGSSEYCGDAISDTRSYGNGDMEFMIGLEDLKEGSFQYYS